MDKVIGVGVEAAHGILDDGHIVLSIGAVLVAILIVCLIAMYRFFDKQLRYHRETIKAKDAEIERLYRDLIDIQERTAGAINGIGGVIRSTHEQY